MERKKPSRQERMRAFLAALKRAGQIEKAAEQAGVAVATVYRWRQRYKSFRESWERLLQQGGDDLEWAVLERAIDGVEEPVFYKGVECGFVRKYSAAREALMLRALKPERYGRAAGEESDGANERVVVVYPPNGRD